MLRKIEELEEQLKANDEALKSSKTLIEKLKAEVVRLGGNVAAL